MFNRRFNQSNKLVEMSKKMYPKNSSISKNTASDLAAVIQYTVPQTRDNAAGFYIEFYAFDPALGRMRRKTIKLNRVNGLSTKRRYAINNL
jgi:hypothetical protein